MKLIPFPIKDEQLAYTATLVQHSIDHHTVRDGWSGGDVLVQRARRTTGTLTEVVFADVMGLPRPLAAFGAVDGQDYGMDFALPHKNTGGACGQMFLPDIIVDVKGMHRKSPRLEDHYALNIPAKSVERTDFITDLYYHVSIVGKDPLNPVTAVFVGGVRRESLLDGTKGVRLPRGTKRSRANGTSFALHADIYEVSLGDLSQLPPTYFRK